MTSHSTLTLGGFTGDEIDMEGGDVGGVDTGNLRDVTEGGGASVVVGCNRLLGMLAGSDVTFDNSLFRTQACRCCARRPELRPCLSERRKRYPTRTAQTAVQRWRLCLSPSLPGADPHLAVAVSLLPCLSFGRFLCPTNGQNDDAFYPILRWLFCSPSRYGARRCREAARLP